MPVFSPYSDSVEACSRLNNLFTNLCHSAARGAGGRAHTLGNSSVDNRELIMNSVFLFLVAERELQEKHPGYSTRGFIPATSRPGKYYWGSEAGYLNQRSGNTYLSSHSRHEGESNKGWTKHGRIRCFTINENQTKPNPTATAKGE